MDQQQPGPSLEELLAILAAQTPQGPDPAAQQQQPQQQPQQPQPSPGRDALAALLARVNKPGGMQQGPVANIGIRG